MDGDFRQTVRVTRPTRTTLLMLAFLALVALVAFVLATTIYGVFLANPYLNGLIIAVLIVGICYTFWQVFRLNRCVDWIDAFIAERPGFDTIQPPPLLLSMAGMLRDPEARRGISPTIVRAILDSIATRLDESRDITRYAANLLIFLGLLGTFWGLSITVPLVVATIRDLAPADGADASAVFSRLVANLGEQMRGLGTAFASSLLGLAGSLVLGFLEILAGHAQNRFYRELEEALSQVTRIARGGGDGDEAGGYLADALGRNFETMEALSERLMAAETRGIVANDKLEVASYAMMQVAGRMADDNDLFERMIDSQDAMRRALLDATERNKGVLGGMDEGTRERIASIDTHLLRIAEELSAGRTSSTSELKSELRNLTRLFEAAARGELDGQAD